MKTLSCIAVVGMLIVATTLSKANELSVTIMGSGSPDYDKERASAGYLVRQGDTQILVDMGSGVRANLYRAGVDDRKLDALLFTHHHIDHNAEFNSILIRGVVGRDAILIYGQSNIDTLVFTHFAPGKVDEKASLEVIRKNFSGKVVFSSDLLELSCAGKMSAE